MAGSVTVPGLSGSTITQTFGNQQNFLLAQQFANEIVAASRSDGLNITDASTTGGAIPPPPANSVSGGVNELIITAGGVYSIPAGSQGAPDYLVILDNTAPVTIFGSPNTSIWGGGSHVTIVDPSTTVLSEGAGDAVATLTGAGDVLAGNNQNDTLLAAGTAESIAAGTGTNSLFASGTNDLHLCARHKRHALRWFGRRDIPDRVHRDRRSGVRRDWRTFSH